MIRAPALAGLLVALFASPPAWSDESIGDFLKRAREGGSGVADVPAKSAQPLHCIGADAGSAPDLLVISPNSEIPLPAVGRCTGKLLGNSFSSERQYPDQKFWPPKCQKTYSQLFGGELRYDTIQNLNRFIVQRISAEVGPGKEAVVESPAPTTSGKPAAYPGYLVKPAYKVWTDNQGVHVGLVIKMLASTHQQLKAVPKSDGTSSIMSYPTGVEDNVERVREIFDSVNQCVGFVTGFWNRYGIKMEMNLVLKRNLKDADRLMEPDSRSPYPVSQVQLLDLYGRSRAHTWHYGDLGQCDEGCFKSIDKDLENSKKFGRCAEDCNKNFGASVHDSEKEVKEKGKKNDRCWDGCHQSYPYSLENIKKVGQCLDDCKNIQNGGATKDPELCPMLLHETGHILGFLDEYKDPDIQHIFIAQEVNPFSAMANHRMPDLEFFPRHILQLLDPLCR